MMTLEALADECLRVYTSDAAYNSKMIHAVPPARVVDRIQFFELASRDRVVLELGCAESTFRTRLEHVAKKYYGADKLPCPWIKNFVQIDLDAKELTIPSDVQLILCGEVLEHLSNPGFFLDGLRKLARPVMISVPNAFDVANQRWAAEGYENVNADHVAWYSWKTIKTLVERHGFIVDGFWWYDGKPIVAKGIIFLLKAV